MNTAASVQLDHTPKARIFHEKIGDTEYEVTEARLDVFNDVALWNKNPRLLPYITGAESFSETELEAHLRETSGYAPLAKSIADLGQMEPIYVWRGSDHDRYLVLEGATRVAILRDLARKKKNAPEGAKYQRVKAKVLPAHFDEAARVILLARIHVRGTGVRSWGRYVEAKFVYENTYQDNGSGLMSVTELAKYMEKSVSWVSRLREAYRFARNFVEHLDSPEADALAAEHFSTLEEISKSTGFGPKVRNYGDPASDALRAEVFEMVRRDVFKEYRDARFMKEFYEDPDKWLQLKTGEKHVANRLANDISANGSSLRAKIGTLEGQISRALDREKDALDESDIENLRKALEFAESRVVHIGVSPCQIAFRNFQLALENATLADVRAITPEQFAELTAGLDDFRERAAKHNKSWAVKNG